MLNRLDGSRKGGMGGVPDDRTVLYMSGVKFEDS